MQTVTKKEVALELLQVKDLSYAINLDLTAKTLPKTERKAAEILKDLVGDRVHYIEATQTWYVWNGRVHAPHEGSGVPYQLVKTLYDGLTQALQVVKLSVKNALESQANHEGEGIPEKAFKRAYTDRYAEARGIRDRLASEAGIRAVGRILANELAVPADYFHDDSRWFVVRNGVYDLQAVERERRWELLPHDPSRPVWRYVDVDDDPDRTTYNAAFVRWMNSSVEDAEQAEFLLKALAAALMGARGDTARVVSIQGKPSSGKSMLLNVFEKLCSGTGYFATPSPDAIVKGGRNAEHARWDMAGARIVAFSEVRQELDHTFLLKFSGGDAFSVDRKYMVGGSRKPQGIIFIANNTTLNVDKSDPAMKRRVAPVHFPHSFMPNDPIYPRDPQLQADILSDLQGLLVLLREGYLRFLNDPEVLPLTSAMSDRIDNEAQQEDELGEFLIGYRFDGERELKSSIKFTDLLKDYVTYCKETGQLPPKSKDFRETLLSRGYEIRKSSVDRVKGFASVRG